MIGEQEIRWMREGAVLINASRGNVVDLGALRGALEVGRLAGAAVDVFPTEPMRQRLEGVVRLRVDVMDQGEGADLMARYSVEKLPTTLVLTPNGVRMAAVQGFMGAKALIQAIDDEIAKYQRVAGALDKVLASDQIELQTHVARDLHKRLDGARSARLYEKILASEDLGAEKRGELLFYLSDAYRLAGDFARAQARNAQARSAAGSNKDPDFLPRVDFLAYYIARNQGDCETAQGLLEGFIETHHDTTYAREARRFLRDLRRGDRKGCHTKAASL
jgi:hypothetical protein